MQNGSPVLLSNWNQSSSDDRCILWEERSCGNPTVRFLCQHCWSPAVCLGETAADFSCLTCRQWAQVDDPNILLSSSISILKRVFWIYLLNEISSTYCTNAHGRDRVFLQISKFRPGVFFATPASFCNAANSKYDLLSLHNETYLSVCMHYLS